MKLIKPTKYLIFGLILYALPIILFGDFSNIYKCFFLPLTCIILYLRMVKKTYRKLDLTIDSAMVGCFLGVYGLTPFLIMANKTLFNTSFTYSNIFGYWTAFIFYVIMYNIYRTKLKEYLFELFENDPVRMQRDHKINSILRKW